MLRGKTGPTAKQYQHKSGVRCQLVPVESWSSLLHSYEERTWCASSRCSSGKRLGVGGMGNFPFFDAKADRNFVRFAAHAGIPGVGRVIFQDGRDHVGVVSAGNRPTGHRLAGAAQLLTDLGTGFEHGVHVLLFVCINGS